MPCDRIPGEQPAFRVGEQAVRKGGPNAATIEVDDFSVLAAGYTFCSQSECTDGEEPLAGLFHATNGDLYGTTADGGANGLGTIFKIAPSGKLMTLKLMTLYSFCAQTGCTDGQAPESALVQAGDGDLYGTTVNGGAGYGTVFKITAGGTLTTLHSFCSQSGCPDGDFPVAGLVQATDGNLYGTTLQGGLDNFYGTIYNITPGGALTTLYTFSEPGRPSAQRGAVPSHQWGPLRDDPVGRGINYRRLRRSSLRLWHDLQAVHGPRPVCGNTDYLRLGGGGHQDSGDRPDRCDRRHI
jgi:uncharacterized repeat protein (TIGR03803 family)